MNRSGGGATGLLLAMMEPSASFEEEFQDWYDIEHFPERRAINGFLTATRLICIDGWPRYLALYDLTDIEVLQGDDYAKIAGNNYSQWTSRIVPRMWGHYRAEGTQIYPRAALFGDGGRASRTLIWRFRQVPLTDADLIVDGLKELYEGRPETAQVRVFTTQQRDTEADYLGIIELHVPYTPEPGSVKALGNALKYLDMVNAYTCYNRR